MNDMNRREALKRTALFMGTALSASTIAGLMQGCKTEPELAWTPSLFTEDEARLVSEMSGTIIPRTGTPGAIEVGVPKFIEDMVKDVYKEDERARFNEGMKAFAEAASGFSSMSDEKQKEVLLDYNTRMQEAMGQREEWPADLEFFRRVKELTVAGFFTSEVGATQVLQYKAIPVEYHGCISIEEAGGKTWAT